MDEMKEKIEKRIAELKTSLQKLEQSANAHIGAIQEFERILKDTTSEKDSQKLEVK